MHPSSSPNWEFRAIFTKNNIMSLLKLSKEQAETRADALAKRLGDKLGGTWKTKVWWNMWWCYSVFCGTVSLSEYGEEDNLRYSALIASDMDEVGVGSGIWSLPHNQPRWQPQTFSTPEDAVKASMSLHLDVVDRIKKVADTNRNNLNKFDWSSRHNHDHQE